MFKNRKVMKEIILAVLLLCTAYLVYSIIANPLGEHDIILALVFHPLINYTIFLHKILTNTAFIKCS